jgi:hypothetical protein
MPVDKRLIQYDYDKQACVVDGRYIRCGHRDPCDCYGTAHEGEIARGPNIR